MRYLQLLSILFLSLSSVNAELYREIQRKHHQSGLPLAMMQVGEEPVKVELATTEEAQIRGLMERMIMPRNMGMLFIFEDLKPRSFWMKNTKIPLDILYLDDQGVIVDIIQAEPCKHDPCSSYPSRAPAKYVLELNAGMAEVFGVGIGDSLVRESNQ